MKIKIAPVIKLNPKNPVSSASSSRDILYGTGLTKAVVKKANRLDLSSPALSASTTSEEIDVKNQLTSSQSLTTVLPSSLMSNDIILDPDQIAAKLGMINQKYSILIGSAGTGKTTTLKALIIEIEPYLPYILAASGDKIPSIAFVAFMGKAVQQMKRALPRNYHSLCSTIHVLLEFKPVYEDVFDKATGEMKSKMQFLPERNANNKLELDCIFIDECGTLGVPLWHYLLDALPSTCRIILLGDLNQLVPVAGHSILGFAMLAWPTYELTKLHRNAGPIAENAHRVIEGKKPLTDETKKVIVKKMDDGSIGARKELLGTIQYLYKAGKFDPMQDAVIVPQNVDVLGQIQLNEVLVNLFNPKANRIAIKAGTEIKVLAVGDKIMVLKNMAQRRLTNGMQGVITSIATNNSFKGSHNATQKANALVTIDLQDFDKAFDAIEDLDEDSNLSEGERQGSHVITIQFQDVEGETTFSTVGELQAITLSYVFTCHKAQGSEYRFVIVLCHSANHRMLCREWLYTAMTRAKSNLLVMCNNRGLTQAVKVQRIKGITMKDKAEKFIALTKLSPNEPPAVIPKAEKLITKTNLQFNIKKD